MEYLDVVVNRYADVQFFNKLKNNFEYFVEKLTENGYINEDLPIELWGEVGYNYNITQIQELINSIEKATYDIDFNSDWINPYSYYIDYGEQNPVHWYVWEQKQKNKLSLVKRWIDWMNFNRKIVENEEQKQQYLSVQGRIDEGGSITIENLYDQDGNQIMTLEGYFSEGKN